MARWLVIQYCSPMRFRRSATGEIRIKDRTWWQTALNTISFGLFYKEEVKAEITGTDDSYDQPGFDITKHAVRIEYLISNTALSEETVKDSAFTQYTGAIDLSADDQYVIYARLTDHAGNTAYAGSDGFEIDKTAPAIEVLSPVSKVLDSETTIYKFCTTALVFRAADKNLASVTAENPELLTTDADGNYVLSYKEGSVPVHWTCDGGTEYDMKDGDRTTVGTEITLFLNDESLEFCSIVFPGKGVRVVTIG